MGPLLSFYTTHGVFPAAQMAARAAVLGPQDAVLAMRDAYAERRDLLLAGLRDCPAIQVPVPRGAFYAFADVSAARAGRPLWTLIEEWLALGIAALPGPAFGAGFDDRVRLALCTAREDVIEAARRLAGRYGDARP